MKTHSTDLLSKHFDLFSEVMDFNENNQDVVICPSCDFKLSYKNHPVSFETAVNKVISHSLDTHK
jgi:hypothetical protein